MRTEVFLDTSYAIALSAPSDKLHRSAIYLAELIEAEGTSLVTTQAVMLDIGNALSKQLYRPAASALLNSLEADPKVEIVPVSPQLYARAFELYCERPETEWRLIECVSFVVMQTCGITEALTANDHFQQAGFRALLRENFGQS
jgi:hypothetical protein